MSFQKIIFLLASITLVGGCSKSSITSSTSSLSSNSTSADFVKQFVPDELIESRKSELNQLKNYKVILEEESNQSGQIVKTVSSIEGKFLEKKPTYFYLHFTSDILDENKAVITKKSDYQRLVKKVDSYFDDLSYGLQDGADIDNYNPTKPSELIENEVSTVFEKLSYLPSTEKSFKNKAVDFNFEDRNNRSIATHMVFGFEHVSKDDGFVLSTQGTYTLNSKNYIVESCDFYILNNGLTKSASIKVKCGNTYLIQSASFTYECPITEKEHSDIKN